MTRDDLIQIAREAGFTQSNPHADLIVIHSNGSWVGIEERLQHFAELVAAAEREACLDAADKAYATDHVLNAIRARGGDQRRPEPAPASAPQINPNAPCRNALMRDGKSYPKSSCQRCGTLLRTGWKCAEGVEP